MRLNASLDVWLIGGHRVRQAPGLWRSLANLLVTGSLEQPLLEEAASGEELVRSVAQALSSTAHAGLPVPVEHGWRLEGLTKSDALTVSVRAYVTHRHHPLDPAVSLELTFLAEPGGPEAPKTAKTATLAMQTLERALRENLSVARLERDARPAGRTPETAGDEDLAFAELSVGQAVAGAMVPTTTDDVGGGALDAANIGDAGGGTFGGDDTGGGSF